MTSVEQAQSTVPRKLPYVVLWALWFLATAVYGVVWAAVIYVWGNKDTVSIYFTLSGGLWLGILQGLVLRRYLTAKNWWAWVISSGAGWLAAMVFLFMGLALASAAAGLNPEGNSALCGIQLYCLAGAAFGLIQAIGFLSKKYDRFDVAMWMITNAFAWAVGGLLGGLVTFAVYGPMSIGPDWYSDSFHDVLHIALGILTAMLVIGAFTGALVAAQVRFIHLRTNANQR